MNVVLLKVLMKLKIDIINEDLRENINYLQKLTY